MTTRERWYALHRARRAFYRDQRQHFLNVTAFGSSVQVLDVHGPASEYILRAREFAVSAVINPPLIVDPMLPLA